MFRTEAPVIPIRNWNYYQNHTTYGTSAHSFQRYTQIKITKYLYAHGGWWVLAFPICMSMSKHVFFDSHQMSLSTLHIVWYPKLHPLCRWNIIYFPWDHALSYTKRNRYQQINTMPPNQKWPVWTVQRYHLEWSSPRTVITQPTYFQLWNGTSECPLNSFGYWTLNKYYYYYYTRAGHSWDRNKHYTPTSFYVWYVITIMVNYIRQCDAP